MFITVNRSLNDLLGNDYVNALCDSAQVLLGISQAKCEKYATKPRDFFPGIYQRRMEGMLSKVGLKITSGLKHSISGAGTESFTKATNIQASPLATLGYLRIGEDGRLYLTAKSEHYHTPLGHSFPGFQLLEDARNLGVTNATHNNTRGYITRLLEKKLVCAANDIPSGDEAAFQRTLSSREPHTLNRVINLETGSLAVEAGVKMMLARFYRHEPAAEQPRNYGKIPVFLVMADLEGGPAANYHGTTVMTQMMRGLWPDFYAKMDSQGIFKVCPVKINDMDDFKQKIQQYNRGECRIAGFMHEIVLMNYGAIRLDEAYLRTAYSICHQNDIPVLADEIQSCMWYKDFFLYKRYGLRPDFVIMGKGFPGGQYAASRIITTAEMDSLSQFGALVTNGQEEMASLSYLITMEWARENADIIEKNADYFQNGLCALQRKYPHLIHEIEGEGFLCAIQFHDTDTASRFCSRMNAMCIDISAQTYKKHCPPAALMKPPLICSPKVLDFLLNKMEDAFDNL